MGIAGGLTSVVVRLRRFGARAKSATRNIEWKQDQLLNLLARNCCLVYPEDIRVNPIVRRPLKGAYAGLLRLIETAVVECQKLLWFGVIGPTLRQFVSFPSDLDNFTRSDLIFPCVGIQNFRSNFGRYAICVRDLAFSPRRQKPALVSLYISFHHPEFLGNVVVSIRIVDRGAIDHYSRIAISAHLNVAWLAAGLFKFKGQFEQSLLIVEQTIRRNQNIIGEKRSIGFRVIAIKGGPALVPDRDQL